MVKDANLPTLTGSPEWLNYLGFLEEKLVEYGVVDVTRNSWDFERWYTSNDATNWSLVSDGEAGQGRVLLRVLGLDRSAGHHRRDGLLRPRQPAGVHQGQDRGDPDAAAPRAAVRRGLHRELHLQRLRVPGGHRDLPAAVRVRGPGRHLHLRHLVAVGTGTAHRSRWRAGGGNGDRLRHGLRPDRGAVLLRGSDSVRLSRADPRPGGRSQGDRRRQRRARPRP